MMTFFWLSSTARGKSKFVKLPEQVVVGVDCSFAVFLNESRIFLVVKHESWNNGKERFFYYK